MTTQAHQHLHAGSSPQAIPPGMEDPTMIEAHHALTACRIEPTGRVGAVSDEELDQHIVDCGVLMERAYARFQAHGNPADRDEALMWMFRQQEAMRSRSPAAVAAREARIRQAIDDGVGFFLSPMALHMGRTGRVY